MSRKAHSAFLDAVADQLNLRWAWEKVRRRSVHGDKWFDEIDLAGFELRLEENLGAIAAEMREGHYRLARLRPLPFPKADDSRGRPRLRQVFDVSARDQVAWTAVVNVVGPHVDSRMPAWSYGNRLYRSIWVQEDATGLRRRRIGRYRHSSGALYLPFRQSWPVFRRHVYLATRAMTASARHAEMDPTTEEELALQERLQKEYRCPFVLPEYWSGRRPAGRVERLWWCGVDLARFYPSINLGVVLKNIVGSLPLFWREDAFRLLQSMLRFRLALDGWDAEGLRAIGLTPRSRFFSHIPTGLLVDGFLANAGLLESDLEVQRLLPQRRVAHFRFVDDHVILAYSFDDLLEWVEEYQKLLAAAGSGARVNPDKVEPAQLATFLRGARRHRSASSANHARALAEKSCELDPEFPTPLMTKTIALMSGLAQTHMDLLEPAELAGMADQLEHLLLVDLPEDEIKERTRRAFAATRLTRVVECQLAAQISDAIALNGGRESDAPTQAALEGLFSSDGDNGNGPRQEVSRESPLKPEMERALERAFGLLVRVLRERPDRVRLWARAVVMCRRTGARGLAQLVHEIARIRSNGGLSQLAAECLMANLLSLLSSETIAAALTLNDDDAADWRREAARSFLMEAMNVPLPQPHEAASWFAMVSWRQYCLGLLCARLILEDSQDPVDANSVNAAPPERIAVAEDCLRTAAERNSPAAWAWWACRRSLGHLQTHATPLVMKLGGRLPVDRTSVAFWKFFPLDLPDQLFAGRVLQDDQKQSGAREAGWWFDARRARKMKTAGGPAEGRQAGGIAPDEGPGFPHRTQSSFHEWCEFLQDLRRRVPDDPRAGEWTALEVVRQTSHLLELDEGVDSGYLRRSSRRRSERLSAHPANFTVPRAWLDPKSMTWDEWFRTCEVSRRGQFGVVAVPMRWRIADRRYAPLMAGSPLFPAINVVRGLGLLLYGLLRGSFDLPALWNGPGHSDVLVLLPRLLLGEMTFSSMTLGFLQGMLLPRVTENLHLKALPPTLVVDDDEEGDPVAFQDAVEVGKASARCQAELRKLQISTLANRPRQLTPINVRQLTEPEWSWAFRMTEASDGGREE